MHSTCILFVVFNSAWLKQLEILETFRDVFFFRDFFQFLPIFAAFDDLSLGIVVFT